MPRQIEFDGRVIEVPDDFTDADVAQVLESKASPQARAPQQRDSETLKPTFMAAGGTIGSILGAGGGAVAGLPAGGVGAVPGSIAGGVAGGALGTAAGAYLYDLYRDVKRKFISDPTEPPSTANRLMDPVKEGLLDAAISGGIAGMPAVAAGARAAKRSILGVGDEARMLAGEAERRGIGLGIGDVAENTPVRTFTRTLGQMPFIGGPAKRAQEQKAREIEGAFGRELDRLGPSASGPEIGKEMAGKAEGRFRSVMQNEVRPAYEEVKTLSAKEGAIAPSAKIANAGAMSEVELMKDRPTLASGDEMSQVMPEYLKKFYLELQDLPTHLSVANLQWMKRNVDALAKKASADGFQWKQAMEMRNAIAETIADVAPKSPAARALLNADDLFSRRMSEFENATGKKFEQADKNMFSYGHEKLGSVNADELAKKALNLASPQSVDDLSRLVGPETMGKLSRRVVEDAYSAAHTVNEKGGKVFNVGKFRDSLKLNQPDSAEYQSLAKLYSAQGGDVKDLSKLTEIAQRIFGNEIPDVSTFVARRAALGGGKSAVMAVIPGAAGAAAGHGVAGAGGAAIGGPTMLGAVLLARHGMRIATEPKHLKTLLRGFDPDVPASVRRTALARLTRLYARDTGEEPSPANALIDGEGK